MPLYQNSSVTTSKLILGNYKIETAATVAAAYTNVGAGQLTAFNHSPTFFDTQAGNAPDPVEGIANEEVTIEFEMIEFDSSVLSVISTGMLTHTATSTVLSTLSSGGKTTQTARAFKLTNTSVIAGATKETIIYVYKGTMNSGLSITTKSDNDADPINILPITILGKMDGTRTAGDQLFSITRTV